MSDGSNRSSGAVYRWTCVLALAAAGVAGVTVAVVAEATSATTSAAATAPPQVSREGGRDGEGAGATTSRPWRVRDEAGGGGGRWTRRGLEGPTEEEWREVAGFMARYSPNRLKAIDAHAAVDGPRFANLRRFVWAHYRELMALRDKGDHELYDLRVRMAQAEDQAFGLQRQMREAPDSERPVLRHELRERVTDMMRLGLKERELRIARLEKALAAEKAKLAADKQSIDQRVQDRMQAMSKGLRKRDGDRDGDRDRGRGSATTAVGSQVK